ncbi:CPBP family intramembrane glutamic endopeptidase [Paenibacillus alba]|uniref:CPBP family intramembrane metalloprotease n=1 Tax=Paenibacillus alba TaxID=1197127 RepID=A0ABU6GBZ7_9BACL|nr:CPBP family intramembrane glutamic endopeptidase [Paenibacillus alba]MEC0231708.1 CPBP family intramembrane metalloprotease [Paenibacillus alba]
MKADANIRLFSLFLILFFSISPLLINSLSLFVTGNSAEYSADSHFIFSIIWEVLSLGILYFVLKKQGRNLQEIGFEFRKTDIWHAIVLYIGIYFVYIIAIAISPNFSQAPRNVDFLKTNISIFYVVFILINPFFEELIVRAYTITELKFFIKKEEFSVIASTLIQTSYHLYQGLIPALYVGIMFFIFSIYFVKSKRILPVIIIHLFFDLLAMFNLGKK